MPEGPYILMRPMDGCQEIIFRRKKDIKLIVLYDMCVYVRRAQILLASSRQRLQERSECCKIVTRQWQQSFKDRSSSSKTFQCNDVQAQIDTTDLRPTMRIMSHQRDDMNTGQY